MSENETADLSSLRINRTESSGSPRPKGQLYVRLGIGAAVLAVLTIGGVMIRGALDPAIEVQLTTVSFSSPSQANAVLTASGYVVAQRKAAVASKATGRLEYLGVVEGDKVTKGQIIARIENSDMQAQVEQARANLKVSQAELFDAKQTLDRVKSLVEKGLSPQADHDGAEARYRRVLASIDAAKAAVTGAEVNLENTLIRAPFDGTVLTKNADVGEMVAPMGAAAGSHPLSSPSPTCPHCKLRRMCRSQISNEFNLTKLARSPSMPTRMFAMRALSPRSSLQRIVQRPRSW
jgi:multidrug efflux pump subunit AcrA (membrane-fusion protein)